MAAQFMFKIEPKLKKAAMKKAKEKGVPFSSVLNFAADAFVKGHLNVELTVHEELNPRTKKMLSAALKDIGEGKNLSPVFSSAKEMDEYLDALV